MTPRYLIKGHRPEPLSTVYIVEWEENFGEGSEICAVFFGKEAAGRYVTHAHCRPYGEYFVSEHHVMKGWSE